MDVKIMLVEDEVITAIMIENELNKFGFSVCKRVTTGEKAIKSFNEEKPDLILMDIMLAGNMDGIQASKEILSNKKIPIIFMTGFSDDEMQEKAKKLNPIAYLIKPINLLEVRAIINSIFQ